MSLIITTIIALFLALIPAKIASSKGRSFGKWWVYGFLLWIVAFIHSLLLKKSDAETNDTLQADDSWENLINIRKQRDADSSNSNPVQQYFYTLFIENSADKEAFLALPYLYNAGTINAARKYQTESIIKTIPQLVSAIQQIPHENYELYNYPPYEEIPDTSEALGQLNQAMGLQDNFNMPVYSDVMGQKISKIATPLSMAIDHQLISVFSILKGRRCQGLHEIVAAARDGIVHYANTPIVRYFFSLPMLEKVEAGDEVNTKEFKCKLEIAILKGTENLLIDLWNGLGGGETITDALVINKIRKYF
jgi:hypothetical protein